MNIPVTLSKQFFWRCITFALNIVALAISMGILSQTSKEEPFSTCLLHGCLPELKPGQGGWLTTSHRFTVAGKHCFIIVSYLCVSCVSCHIPQDHYYWEEDTNHLFVCIQTNPDFNPPVIGFSPKPLGDNPSTVELVENHHHICSHIVDCLEKKTVVIQFLVSLGLNKILNVKTNFTNKQLKHAVSAHNLDHMSLTSKRKS